MKSFVGLLLLGSIPATTRPDTAPAAMDIDKGEPHFEGKTILTALEKAIQKRRNKRKRSHEYITQSLRYCRHLVTSPSTTGSRVDGDGDAAMGGMTNGQEALDLGSVFLCGSGWEFSVPSRVSVWVYCLQTAHLELRR